MKSHYKVNVIVVGFFIVFLSIVFTSHVLNKQIGDIVKEPAQSTESVEEDNSSEKSDLEITKRKVLRIERKPSQEDYTESVVLVDKREVARYKTKDDKIFDVSGRIPDGKVKFVNEWRNTYGFEHYRNGKREGSYTEHYANGNTRTKADYQKGRLKKRKSYYYNNVLRMEEDYSTARFISRMQSLSEFKNVGIGKIYRLDGSLRYEWSAVDDSDEHYTKRYNRGGELIEALYYNDQWELLESGTASEDLSKEILPIEPIGAN